MLSSWAPTQELKDFLDEGPPPVVVTFSSMIFKNDSELPMLFAVLRRCRTRAVILSGWSAETIYKHCSHPDHLNDVYVAKHQREIFAVAQSPSKPPTTTHAPGLSDINHHDHSDSNNLRVRKLHKTCSLSPHSPQLPKTGTAALLKDRSSNSTTAASTPPSRQFFVLNYCDHEWLFKRALAVLHHGGVGTTFAILNAAIPSLACPFAFDQQLWGEQLFKLGIGVYPLIQAELSEESLFQAFQILLAPDKQREMREKAKMLRTQLKKEQGVKNAVDFLLKNLPFTPFCGVPPECAPPKNN